MDTTQTYFQIDRDKLHWQQIVEKSIASKIQLQNLHIGGQVLRNEKGWRENEKEIEYVWLVTISKSFMGSLTLFTIKFAENRFREFHNKEALLKGIVNLHSSKEIDSFFIEKNEQYFDDPIMNIAELNLFEKRSGIVLDGTSYEILIRAAGIESTIYLNNPNGKFWKYWTKELTALGKEIADKSDNVFFTDFFKY